MAEPTLEPSTEPTLEPSTAPAPEPMPPRPAVAEPTPSTAPEPTPPSTQRKAARRERLQVPHEPVTVHEATAAASVALAGIRERCTSAPKVIAVELDIEDGRGQVARLNFKPAAGFKAASWEKCVRGELESVKYPARAAPSHVVLRLQR
ncbi:hypothetical protein [Nannocystis pusilla]|uniref:hypothetical protein n=1 Tax=Nannocystis pusilla TaxID=889268 RepID=UPI003B7CAEB9